MENKILFLIIAIFGLYLLFSETGQRIVKNIIGASKGSNTVPAKDLKPDTVTGAGQSIREQYILKKDQ